MRMKYRRKKKRYMKIHVFKARQLESLPRYKHAFSAEPEEKMVEFFLDKMIVFIPRRPQNTVKLHTTEKYCRSLQECWAQHSIFKKNNYFILQIHNIFDLR